MSSNEDNESSYAESTFSFRPVITQTKNDNWVNSVPSFANFENYLSDVKVKPNEKEYTYQINIPRYFLPTKIQLLYGFDKNETALVVTITYKQYNNERDIKIELPDSTSEFMGSKLIQMAARDFVKPDYQPKTFYRSYPFIVTGPTSVSQKQLSQLFLKGFNRVLASRILSNCENDVDKSLKLLSDGEIPLSSERPNINSILPYATNPLVYLVMEIVDCIIDLQDHCFICRASIPPVIKPSTCGNHNCITTSTLSSCTDILSEIKRDVKVADLLFSFFVNAIGTDRLIPGPPPLSVAEIESLAEEHSRSTTKRALNQDDDRDQPRLNHDPDRLNRLVKKVPAFAEIVQLANSRALRDRLGGECYNLLQWVLQSNRTQFFWLPPELQIPELHNKDGSMPLQFMTLMSSPEQEAIFQALKAKFGSIYMWHGSPLKNWHSIIRNGLLDGTKHNMIDHGDACGAGIYFAHNSSYSLSYSYGFGRDTVTNAWGKTELDKNLTVISLCEVINFPTTSDAAEYSVDVKNYRTGEMEKKTFVGFLKSHGDVMTLSIEEACIVRFILVGFDNNINIYKNPPSRIPTFDDLVEYITKKKKSQ